MKMKTLAIIPARMESVRFPNKPLAKINGIPMIRRVVQNVMPHVDKCIVATTQGSPIHAVVKDLVATVEVAAECHTGTDRCYEAYMQAKPYLDSYYDLIINVQGDEPLITEEHITAIKSSFDSHCPIPKVYTLSYRIKREDVFQDNWVYVTVNTKQNAMYFSRRVIPSLAHMRKENKAKNVKSLIRKHIGVYGFSPASLSYCKRLPSTQLEQIEDLEQLKWLAQGVQLHVSDVEHNTIPVDFAEDIERVERYFMSKSNNIFPK
jgi:3-deoxy-manno-octulosonate cytidylyltransferase (CMP-KDO synthetase)